MAHTRVSVWRSNLGKQLKKMTELTPRQPSSILLGTRKKTETTVDGPPRSSEEGTVANAANVHQERLKEYHKRMDASMMSMRRKIAGLRPDQIRQLPKEELDLPVSVQDFDEALDKCNKSVSREDLNKYEKWMKEFGST
uniref:Spastin/Vps4 C-terminal domain-containing protein n=1 Tax=Timema tahoe TaxID=61484 RepID=A0A7R9IGH9_9NEOP|nr:unnamed protein product [Timema tahoe]